MHLPGCKTWHTHGAAGRKVAGKSSGPRRNPGTGRGQVFRVPLATARRKLAQSEQKLTLYREKFSAERAKGNEAAAKRLHALFMKEARRISDWQNVVRQQEFYKAHPSAMRPI